MSSPQRSDHETKSTLQRLLSQRDTTMVQNPTFRAALSKLWSCYKLTYMQPSADGNTMIGQLSFGSHGLLQREEYITVQILLTKALDPTFDRRTAHEQAVRDWIRDHRVIRGRSGIDFDTYASNMYDLLSVILRVNNPNDDDTDINKEEEDDDDNEILPYIELLDVLTECLTDDKGNFLALNNVPTNTIVRKRFLEVLHPQQRAVDADADDDASKQAELSGEDYDTFLDVHTASSGADEEEDEEEQEEEEVAALNDAEAKTSGNNDDAQAVLAFRSTLIPSSDEDELRQLELSGKYSSSVSSYGSSDEEALQEHDTHEKREADLAKLYTSSFGQKPFVRVLQDTSSPPPKPAPTRLERRLSELEQPKQTHIKLATAPVAFVPFHLRFPPSVPTHVSTQKQLHDDYVATRESCANFKSPHLPDKREVDSASLLWTEKKRKEQREAALKDKAMRAKEAEAKKERQLYDFNYSHVQLGETHPAVYTRDDSAKKGHFHPHHKHTRQEAAFMMNLTTQPVHGFAHHTQPNDNEY